MLISIKDDFTSVLGWRTKNSVDMKPPTISISGSMLGSTMGGVNANINKD